LGILSTQYAANIRIIHRKNAANNVLIRRIWLGAQIKSVDAEASAPYTLLG
jgi:hypothetical protein